MRSKRADAYLAPSTPGEVIKEALEVPWPALRPEPAALLMVLVQLRRIMYWLSGRDGERARDGDLVHRLRHRLGMVRGMKWLNVQAMNPADAMPLPRPGARH